MAQTIKLKRSSVSGNTPSTSDLELGEVAINTYDGKMFIKKNDGSDSIVEIGGSSGTVTEAFKTIAVSGQSSVVADSATDTLTLVAGSNMTITTNASGDTITFASSGGGGGGSQNLFSTFAVSGQNSVVADSTTDTLTLVAGTGITLTTDASTDSITITNSATGANAFGNVVVSGQSTVAADGTNDNLTLVAGTGITLTTDASADSVTITNSAAASNSFGTIAVSGQGSVVADQANDTLTLVAGSNITLTTSAAGDSVTIASSGGGGGGSVDAGASITEFKFDVSSSTSSFSGSDANSNTLAYTAGAIQVYLNGILLDPATDYTATNGTAVVLTDAASSGDDLQIIAFNRKILNANTTVNTFTGDGSTTAFTLSTDPVNENNTNIFIDGVYQSKSNYSVSGTTLTFSTAPPNGSAIEVSLGFQQASISSTLDFADNAILRVGTGNDLQILHDGSNSIIKDTGTGDLQIGASTLDIKNAALNETMIKAIQAGAVELYHNNSKKLETVTGGVTVTGTVTATTFSGDLSGTINATTTGTTQSASDNSTKIATTAYVDTAVTNLVDSAPGTLNTLNELAAALGDDANFSTTITNSLATKVGLTATTGAANIPAGTTGQRPGSPAAGQFRYNSTLNQFEGYTSSWGAIGGGGTNTFTTNVFTGDGSTTAFTLSQAVSSVNDCIVHVGGIYQVPTDAYTVSGTTLTFTSAPANTRKIVVYSVKAGVSGNNLNIQTFSGDGSATSFTMSVNPINENNTIVHIDGVYQQKSSYSTSGTTLTFSAAPANGTTIEVATFTQTEINVPVNDTIDTVHIKDDAVTSAKLGGNLTTPGNLTVTGTLTGTLATAAQTNITSVGTLTGLTLSGALVGTKASFDTTSTTDYALRLTDNGVASYDVIFPDTSTYQLTTNTTSDKTFKLLNSGSGSFNLNVEGSITGTLATAAQPNITSTGTLNALSIAGNLTVDTNTLHVDASNNAVVIGGTNPQGGGLLTLEGPDANMLVLHRTADTGDQEIIFMDHGDHNATIAGKDGGGLRLLTNGRSTTAIDMLSNGNVGIGTTSPAKRLHIFDSTQTNQSVRFGNPAAAPYGEINFNSTGFEHLYIDSHGTTTGYGNIAFRTGPTPDTRMFIHADGTVGIGTNNPSATLHVDPAPNVTTSFGSPLIKVGGDNSWGGNGSIYSIGLGYVDSSVPTKSPAEIGLLTTDNSGHTKGALVFATRNVDTDTAPSERMRIDSSGNVLVGSTDTSLYNNTSGGGIMLAAANRFDAARAGDVVATFNRSDSDGQVIQVYRSGTQVGSVSAEGGDSLIVSGGNAATSGGGLLFHGTAGKVLPARNTASIDSTIDLGQASRRFKDIYSAGGILLSGTAAKNRLENFEDKTEVTNSINLYKGSTLVSSSYNARYGFYSRVGNLVFISFYFYVNTGGATSSGEYRVYGFPFNFTQLTGFAYQSIQANYLTMNGTNIFNSASGDHRWQANSTTYVSLYGQYADTNWTSGLIEFAGSGILYVN